MNSDNYAGCAEVRASTDIAENGQIIAPTRPGLGVTPRAEFVQAYRQVI